MDEPDRPDDRRALVRATWWAGGGVLALAVAMYSAFWLPYREPGKEEPYPLPILPRPQDRVIPGREEKGLRIPVDEAMDRLVGKLPTREGAEKGRKGRGPVVIPTDAGSGRLPRRDKDR